MPSSVPELARRAQGEATFQRCIFQRLPQQLVIKPFLYLIAECSDLKHAANDTSPEHTEYRHRGSSVRAHTHPG